MGYNPTLSDLKTCGSIFLNHLSRSCNCNTLRRQQRCLTMRFSLKNEIVRGDFRRLRLMLAVVIPVVRFQMELVEEAVEHRREQ